MPFGHRIYNLSDNLYSKLHTYLYTGGSINACLTDYKLQADFLNLYHIQSIQTNDLQHCDMLHT